MDVAVGTDLRSLSKHPFDLLLELERRSKVALAGASGSEVDVAEWVGIGFRMVDENFIVAREAIKEVMTVPPSITRVPGAKAWIRGLANVRGQLMPLMDLRLFLGAGPTVCNRDSRVLVVNSSELPVGIMVDEVFGFRRFIDRERRDENPQTVVRCDRYLDGVCERGEESWPVFSVDRLLGSEEFQKAAD